MGKMLTVRAVAVALGASTVVAGGALFGPASADMWTPAYRDGGCVVVEQFFADVSWEGADRTLSSPGGGRACALVRGDAEGEQHVAAADADGFAPGDGSRLAHSGVRADQAAGTGTGVTAALEVGPEPAPVDQTATASEGRQGETCAVEAGAAGEDVGHGLPCDHTPLVPMVPGGNPLGEPDGQPDR